MCTSSVCDKKSGVKLPACSQIHDFPAVAAVHAACFENKILPVHIRKRKFLGFFIRYCFSLIAFAIVMIVTERRKEELYLFAYLPLVSLYNGYFLRFARLWAHTSELFFFTSYRDPWNPRKTSVCAQLERA